MGAGPITPAIFMLRKLNENECQPAKLEVEGANPSRSAMSPQLSSESSPVLTGRSQVGVLPGTPFSRPATELVSGTACKADVAGCDPLAGLHFSPQNRGSDVPQWYRGKLSASLGGGSKSECSSTVERLSYKQKVAGAAPATRTNLPSERHR